MPRPLCVHLLPELTTPEALAGAAVAVIDVLRASTTITQALGAGAVQVLARSAVAEARRTAEGIHDPPALLGGERDGLPIAGFDLGNSPGEYTPQRVSGRTIVFTTTNGTRALAMCGQARRVVLAALTNAAAVARFLHDQPAVHLLCAGTRGEITYEDALLAGLLVHRLQDAAPGTWARNDSARLAADAWTAALGTTRPAAPRLAEVLRQSLGGRNLCALNLQADIDEAAQLDRHDLVPCADASGTIRLA